MSTCPSCPLSQTPYEDQLDQKRDKLVGALRAYRRFETIEIAPTHASPQTQGYRNRARMVVRPQAESPADILGFYEEGSRTVVPVETCQAHHPSVESVLEALRPLLFRYGALRHFAQFVDTRSTAGHAADEESVIVTLAGPLESEEADSKLDELVGNAAALQHELDDVLEDLRVAVHLNVDTQHSQSVLSGEQRVVAGDAWLEYELSGQLFRVRPTTFFQVNLPQLEAVHGRMAQSLNQSSSKSQEQSQDEAVGEPELLVDLYCGVGAHGVVLAGAHSAGTDSDTSAQLLGTDIVEKAIELARENARRANVDAAFETASDADAGGWLAERIDSRPFHLVTNPARAGMSAETVAWIGDSRPETILYLSCEPRTLSRDLDRLAAYGFELRSIEPFDFMPQTDQVETLAVLEPADKPPELDRERAFQPHDPADRHFSPGVSGPAGLPDSIDQLERCEWVALVAGETPKHGFLPHARDLGDDQERIEVNRLRKVEGNSVLRIEATTADDTHIRQRLRAWNHPVIGDDEYGDRNANHLAEKHAFLDRAALHCVKVEAGEQTWTAQVPGAFLGLMRLPRKVLESALTRPE